MISRRQTREYLLQLLYARACIHDMDRGIFVDSYFSEKDPWRLDHEYLISMEKQVLLHERILIDTIALLAPKFDIDWLPTLHLIILMMAITEMNYLEPEVIPEKISVNEAIELARKFSDDQGRGFINWALSTYLKERTKITLLIKEWEFKLFT